MALTPEDVTRIARLARLDLAPDAAEPMRRQLNDFFALVATMAAVDTRGVEPLATPLAALEPVALRLRDDRVTETDARTANQASAPAVERGLYLVPRVVGA